MPTPYSMVNEVFLSKINSTEIRDMFSTSQAQLETFLIPWLRSTIIAFRGCKESLDRNDTTRTFDNNLSEYVIEVLGTGMVIPFLEKEIYDIVQMRAKLYSTDFKAYSEANLLKEKRMLLAQTREVFEQLITNYQIDTLDVTQW